MSMSADELYRRHIARALLDFAAERDAIEHRRRCGQLADSVGLEDALAARLQELIE
jgi:hypothetical protein